MKPKLRVLNRENLSVILSATHHYHVRYNSIEDVFQINYLDLHTQKNGMTFARTIEQAMEWVCCVHVPAKLKEWFF